MEEKALEYLKFCLHGKAYACHTMKIADLMQENGIFPDKVRIIDPKMELDLSSLRTRPGSRILDDIIGKS